MVIGACTWGFQPGSPILIALREVVLVCNIDTSVTVGAEDWAVFALGPYVYVWACHVKITFL